MKNRQLLIKYLAAISLSLFSSLIPEQAKAQSIERTEVEGCSLELKENEINIFSGSVDLGCNFEYKLRDQTTEYSVAFNIIHANQLSEFGAKESSVYVLDSNSGEVYEQKVQFTTGSGAQSLTVSLKNLYNRNKASVVVEDEMVGNGSCTGSLEVTVYDQNLPNKLYRLGNGVVKAALTYDYGSDYYVLDREPYYVPICTDFKDIDNNGITEIVTQDKRFSAFEKSFTSYPPQIIALNTNGFEDVTLQYPNFLRAEAKYHWDEVIKARQEASNSCPYYFIEMASYAAIKSMLGEYPDAIKHIKERINMDLSFHRRYDCYLPNGINTFIPNLEAFLSENNYI
ncbi:MAG: hypothetical protein KME09_12760 [Pleurocapsa minor HA4230-MV1]|jgi:hypothetical protein|nr:hypothetical protein [Pleurocapsa minor HA4230-MV1]